MYLYLLNTVFQYLLKVYYYINKGDVTMCAVDINFMCDNKTYSI